MAHSINLITTTTTVQFLFGMEPHTHTDIVYDDDDDDDDDDDNYDEYGISYDYAYGDPSNMNDPFVRLQFEKCLQQAAHTPQITPQVTP